LASLGELLGDIWRIDASFRIEQKAFSTKVRMINNPNNINDLICIEYDGLGRTITETWNIVCKRGDNGKLR
jgi:hypothetical protein